MSEVELGRDMTRVDRIVYATARRFIILVSLSLFRAKVVGREHLPATGACIVAPVHRSNLDTPFLALLTKRRLRFMGKDSLWNSKFGWFLTALGGFPVVRGTADREALRACEAILDRDEPLVMFPEGTRQRGAHIAELFDGPAFLSARTGAPIIPVGIGGSEGVLPKGAKFPRFKKSTIVVGPPIVPPVSEGRVPRRVVREITEQLAVELQKVFDEALELAGESAEG